MSPTPPPAGSPTHTTWEVDVPFRRSSPKDPEDGQDNQSEPASPVPRITIPRIKPLASGPAPADLAKGLEGKFVDEFGNILDWDGTVLGRVDGDLPSMVGRPVTASGEILDLDGQVAGHVSENYSTPNLKPLGAGLQVDDEGTIYDEQGNVVGKLNKPITDGSSSSSSGEGDAKDKDKDKQSSREQGVRPRAPEAPRPDEIYLDVKSTFDGIQLVIKIPTVFNRGTSQQ